MTRQFRQDWIGCFDLLLPPFCCSTETDLNVRRRHHQQRKMAMLSFWRDGLERQLAAINATIGTLQQQMDRDAQSDG